MRERRWDEQTLIYVKRVQIEVDCNQQLERATAFGVRELGTALVVLSLLRPIASNRPKASGPGILWKRR